MGRTAKTGGRQALLIPCDPRFRYAGANSRIDMKKGAARAPLSGFRRQSYFGASLASAPSFGAPVPDEPMNSLRPSGKVTSRPFALQIGVQALSFD